MSAWEPVPPDVVDACAEGLLARVRARMAAGEERARALRELAVVAARALAGRFAARRVWLFGSLAWGEPHERSDVDLLVEGLAAGAEYRAGALAEEIVGAPVDLVRLEDAPPGLVERVAREGKVLHGPA